MGQSATSATDGDGPEQRLATAARALAAARADADAGVDADEQLARAPIEHARALRGAGQRPAALADLAEVVDRFPADEDLRLRDLLTWAQIYPWWAFGDPERSLAVYGELQRRFADAAEPPARRIAATAVADMTQRRQYERDIPGALALAARLRARFVGERDTVTRGTVAAATAAARGCHCARPDRLLRPAHRDPARLLRRRRLVHRTLHLRAHRAAPAGSSPGGEATCSRSSGRARRSTHCRPRSSRRS